MRCFRASKRWFAKGYPPAALQHCIEKEKAVELNGVERRILKIMLIPILTI